jgi:pimeloyl-ACP methyl ester carboxylesterase
MIADPRGHIDYAESGNGPTVVLVPGSCSTGAAWRPIASQWRDRFRCVTTSLSGYGGTDERRTIFDADISHEVDILEAVIRHAGCPVHLVGHSFGGLCALAVALAGRAPLLSLTIIEAPAAELLNHLGEHHHYGAFRSMTGDYFRAYRWGDRNAVARMIDFYGGAGTFAGWPQRVREYAMETTTVNMLDWRSAYGFPLKAASLSAIGVPGLVMWGAASHPAAKRANELLGGLMPCAETIEIENAAHFAISTHPDIVAEAIADHIDGADRVRSIARCA